MSDSISAIYGTPRGKSKFYEMFMEEVASKTFVSNIMKPMPMIVSPSGPRDVSRHWDWKAGKELDIILPEEKTFIVFDEATEIKKEDWKKMHLAKMEDYSRAAMMEGSFTTAPAPEESGTLTVEKLSDAMKLLGEEVMGSRKKRVPKKKVARADPRKAKYNGRMFGNILLSTTSQIENNTTLNDALTLEGSNKQIEELIVPLFEEFFHKHSNDWQVIGPMTLAAKSVETGKWKSVSALGGETLQYHSVVLGKRDGVCVKWTTGNIVGLDEEMMIDTTIKNFGDKLVPANYSGNPANAKTLIDMLLNFSGEADIVTAAEEVKERVRLAVAAQLKDDIDRKSEAYGESFGLWA